MGIIPLTRAKKPPVEKSVRQMSSSPLISADVLNERLKNTDRYLVVLDTAFVADQSEDAYTDIFMKGHIPGARFFDLHACVTSTPLIPRNLPESVCFSKRVRNLGINLDSNIVVYDHSKSPEAAARLWWLFRLFGCTNIHILDGGYRKWVTDGYNVTTDPQENCPEGNFEAKVNMDLIRDVEDMKKELQTRSSQIVDARNTNVFTGEDDHSQMFNAAKVDLQKPFISMCRTAMMACSLAAAASIIGRPDVPVYYGSWMEWAQVQPGLTTKTVNDVTQQTGS